MPIEVIIIGGGVIGLSTARALHKRGAGRIQLIEKASCGGKASWAAAGMLGPQAEADETGPFFELCSESRDLYPQLASELIAETGIDIELDRAGTMHLAFSEDDARALNSRFSWQKAAGLKVERLEASEVRRAEPFVSPDVMAALYFPGDWQVDNRKLCSALRRYCEINGIEIIENKSVTGIVADNYTVSGVLSGPETFRADRVVIAAGAWTSQIVADLRVEVEPVRGQMISFRTANQFFEHVIYSRNGYIVPRRDGTVLAGSTTEKVGFNHETTDAAAASLFTMAREISPSLSDLGFDAHWSGLRPRAKDGFPVMGSIEGIDGLFIATAHYRNGILLAPITAAIIADNMISGRHSPYLSIFGPDRFRMRAGRIGN